MGLLPDGNGVICTRGGSQKSAGEVWIVPALATGNPGTPTRIATGLREAFGPGRRFSPWAPTGMTTSIGNIHPLDGNLLANAEGSGPGRFESQSLPPGLHLLNVRAEGARFGGKVLVR